MFSDITLIFEMSESHYGYLFYTHPIVSYKKNWTKARLFDSFPKSNHAKFIDFIDDIFI